jgi:diacylglycerol kinase family enzyme
LTVEVSDQASELPEICRRAGQTLRAVVAAGGDGTAAFLANLLPPGVPLAVLPLGTENLLAKHFGLLSDPAGLAAQIAQGATIDLDAGEANGRLFLLMAGCGFDAEVVHRLHASRQGHINHFSYAKPIYEAIRNYQYPELRVVCRDAAGQAAELAARWVFVVNVPRYAGGLSISPGASPHDGLLDVCTFKEGSLLSGLMYLGGVALGQHVRWQDFVTIRATEVRIESDVPVPFQLDGDPGGHLPLEIRVLPGRLTLVVDAAWAGRNGYEPGVQADSTAATFLQDSP